MKLWTIITTTPKEMHNLQSEIWQCSFLASWRFLVSQPTSFSVHPSAFEVTAHITYSTPHISQETLSKHGFFQPGTRRIKLGQVKIIVQTFLKEESWNETTYILCPQQYSLNRLAADITWKKNRWFVFSFIRLLQQHLT